VWAHLGQSNTTVAMAFPAQAIAVACMQPDSCKLSRPDKVIEEQPKEPGKGVKTVHVVELKYTMDYDWTGCVT
jgi:hypothetical protein